MVKKNFQRKNEAGPSVSKPVTPKATEIQAQSKRKQVKPKKSNAFQEIRNLQNTTDLLIPKACFARLIREVMMDNSKYVTRITGEALDALHESSECFLVQLFEDSYACTLHRNQLTLKPRDIRMVIFLKNSDWYDALG